MIVSTALFIAIMMADATTAVPAAQPNPLDKVVCHRQQVTGSLTQIRKECRTRREWNELAGAVRRDAETMRERSSAFRSE
jgi:hypothetical protein